MNRYATSLLVTGLWSGCVLMAAPASAETSSSFGVSAYVPEYCEINASPLVAGEGDGFASGTVFESCNTQDGFQVVAQYRALSADESVAFSYAGEASNLDRDGWSQVASRTGAKFGVRPIGVQYRGLVAPLSIALTVTAF